MSANFTADHRASVDPHEAYLQRTYFPELDGLRAVCALLVISTHLYYKCWDWLAGYRGVSIFFVLSGYLITTLSLREEQARGCLSLAGFYVRRCCRLFPLYYLMLGVYVLCFVLLGRGGAEQGNALAAALPWDLFYCSEVPYYRLSLLPDHHYPPFAHSWTLGIEEKFYLLWPLVAFVCWCGRRRLRLRGTMILTGAFAAVSAALGAGEGVWKMVGHYLHNFYPILIGCLAALLLHERSNFERLRRLALWGRGVPALILFLAVHFTAAQVFGPARQVANLLYPLAATTLLLVLLTGEGPVARSFRPRPLVFIGRLSYGVYLLHMLAMGATHRLLPTSATHPAMSLLAFAVCSLLAISGAWLLSWTIEAPCIRLGRRWSSWLRERSVPAPVATVRA